MRWFRRRAEPDSAPDPVQRAQRFWRDWHEALPEVTAAFGDGEPSRVEAQLCELVGALHPDLHFSVDEGQVAYYALVVSGQEDPALRPVTDAWKAAAPPDTMVWEYHDSVPPVPDPMAVTVNLGARRIPLADVRVFAQVDGDLVDLAVYHPAFAELDEKARTALTFLPLDATLGERLAAQRLRRVESTTTEPAHAITLLQLRDLVTGLGGDSNVGAAG